MNISKQLIDGEWVASSDGATFAVTNPATGEVIGSIPAATSVDIARALTIADDAWQPWKQLGGWKRSAILRKTAAVMTDRAEEIAQRLTAEQGKPISEARLEVAASIEQFDWYADEARRIYGRIPEARDTALRYAVNREPVGPVAAFTPWNFPLLLAVRKIAPALAAGCTMILKPASEAPGAVLLTAEALIEAGLPAGVLQVVTGQAAPISEQLLSSPIIRKFSFTGSVSVGQHLIKLGSANIVNVSMELGGHAPVVIMGDVDPVRAGKLCAAGKFRNAGQICVSPTRFIVHESIAEEFSKAFAEATAQIAVGDGSVESTQMGPMISDGARVRMRGLVEDALSNGASLAHGGGNLPGEGFFFEPTVLLNVPHHAAIMQEEPFGPVAPVTAFETRDEAVQLANSTPFGLAAYVFTNNIADATELSENIQAGIVGVNTFSVSSASVPFGGVKHSGIGAENGTEAMDAYLVSKTVALSPSVI